MSDKSKHCPWCGKKPRRLHGYNMWKVACNTEYCPIEGVVMDLDKWNERKNSRRSPKAKKKT